ncbi:RWD domain-containing protein 3 isoform X2 [Eleutherodactylus coqui]|uniref:RWD domain-containing protein 3 isoform X2 n=1 Tax=Eleutherodactylus coqui TaxID=57060 RepID=UPI0034622810
MSEAALEELAVLAAIYCDPGECDVLARSATYPSCLPNISVSSEELTRAQCKELRDKLLGQARERLSEPMIHDLVLWTQQNCNSLIGNSLQDESSPLSAVTDDGAWTTLLHLDHMRAKSKYVKTVEKWTSDLKLTGKLMFMGKMILILLQGDKRNIREYLVLHKSCKVDVDSSGKKCKERMISVLCEMRLPAEHKRFPTFEVKEYSALSQLENEFDMAGLSKFYTEFVIGLM